MADLWDRLKAAQARAAEPAEEVAPATGPPPPAERAPLGWQWVTPLLAERTLRFALEPRFWAAIGTSLDVQAWKGVLCFDTETTGLSGGAGTVPFLVGWATLLGTEPQVEVRQWFLRDLPGEADLIAALDPIFSAAAGLVSFNGASFDLPLLKGRWAFAGRSFPSVTHRDDLHPSRRLWKRLLESCRLSTVESAVLGIRRVDDVPGALVPALWYDYLRTGAGNDFVTPLEGVLRHHAQDVYSLLCLDLLLAALTADPTAERWEATFGSFPSRVPMARPAPEGLLHPDVGTATPVDFWGLTALHTEEDRDASLEEAWPAQGTEALGLAWADRLKRKGDERAREVWERLWTQQKSYGALEELLKWLEHREKSRAAWSEAVALIDQALEAPFLPRAWKEGLLKRRTRLKGKLGLAGGPTSG